MSASNYLENKLIDHSLGTATYTKPTTVYISLHTADPGETGANEATGGSYARQSAAWNAASSGSATNSGTVTFTCPAGTWTHFGIWDADTSGNFLFSGALSASKTTASGDQVKFNATTITVSAD